MWHGPAPQAGLDPGTQLDELKRPREDVVRSCAETERALARALGVRQQDQGPGVTAPAELLANGEPIAVGERHLEQHQADAPREHPAQCLAAQSRHLDAVAFLHETVPDVEPPSRVAVYEQDVGHGVGQSYGGSGARSLHADANPV